MPVKFRQTIVRFWFFLSYLITTVKESLKLHNQYSHNDRSSYDLKHANHFPHKRWSLEGLWKWETQEKGFTRLYQTQEMGNH